MTYNIYIGYDPREDLAYKVLVKSIMDTASMGGDINIIPIMRENLRHAGIYKRGHMDVDGQCYDALDERPFSTQFSFTRFLVPVLQQYQGWALFMDCDMYLRTDIRNLFDLYCDDDRALLCVQHDYEPRFSRKMDNQIQECYSRKNWSSFVLWNCGHVANRALTMKAVNEHTGAWLHNFNWIEDDDLIGHLPEEWNWLDHWSPETIDAKNVHFTTGGPFFRDWKPSKNCEVRYAAEWNHLAKDIESKNLAKLIPEYTPYCSSFGDT